MVSLYGCYYDVDNDVEAHCLLVWMRVFLFFFSLTNEYIWRMNLFRCVS